MERCVGCTQLPHLPERFDSEYTNVLVSCLDKPYPFRQNDRERARWQLGMGMPSSNMVLTTYLGHQVV